MNRKEIKAAAKEQFRSNYGTHVAVNFVYMLIIGLLGSTFIGTLILGGPLSSGFTEFHKKSARKENAGFNDLTSGFDNFTNAMTGYIFVVLYTFLWSLLLIIPGIIKSYSYAMTIYLINKDHSLSGSEAITLSRKMMKGHKWQLFVLQLSFIGWALLDVLTFGILGIFYVNPYMSQTVYNFYEQVDREYNGIEEATVTE